VQTQFQDGRHRYFGNGNACYKISNYYRILTQIGTQTKKKHADKSGSADPIGNGCRVIFIEKL
jgi:hypothetical protein